MHPTTSPTSAKQQGSVLLEGLIAILIFSMGILALVGLQAAAIKNSSDAKYRADASYLANQIIGQMWADRQNLGSYAHYPGAGAVCQPTGAASANANVASWLTDVGSALPGATASSQQIAVGANNLVTVTVCWKTPQDNTQHNFTTTAQIQG